MFDTHDKKYLKYVLKHKWFVFRAGLKLRVPLHQLLLHDWHKFLPSEWTPYVDNFYRYPDYMDYKRRSEGGYYQDAKDLDEASKNFLKLSEDARERKQRFNKAWLKHLNRAPHHWQHWMLLYDDGQAFTLPMPDRFVREMVADWSGAGRAQGHGNDVSPWYERNKHKIQIHPETRVLVEKYVRQLAKK